MVSLFFVTCLDFCDVCACGIVPFVVSSSFGDVEVSFVMPSMGEVWEAENQDKKEYQYNSSGLSLFRSHIGLQPYSVIPSIERFLKGWELDLC
jgi:hypothetical protein